MTIQIEEHLGSNNVPTFHVRIGEGAIYVKPNLRLAVELIETRTGIKIIDYNVYFIDMRDHLNITLIPELDTGKKNG